MKSPTREVLLTQFIKVRVYAIWSWDGTQQSSLIEGAPFVDKHTLSASVILERSGRQLSDCH